MKYGNWGAVLFAAATFSAGHLTNAILEEFSAIERIDKFGSTFGFAVLYGALLLRTGSLLPLIFLHLLLDYVYVNSGMAGPVAEPIDIRIHMAISAANIAVGLSLLIGVTEEHVPSAGSAVPVN
jgi:membrane protease YdiL (CAAX protease family)